MPTWALCLLFPPCSYALVRLSFALECETLPGLSVPDTAFAFGALRMSIAFAFSVAFTGRYVAERSRFEADSWVDPASSSCWASPGATYARRARVGALLTALIFVSFFAWLHAVSDRDRAVARVERGECAAIER